jgi:hypothetical protein
LPPSPLRDPRCKSSQFLNLYQPVLNQEQCRLSLAVLFKTSGLIAIALAGAFVLGKMSQPSPKTPSNLVEVHYE